MRYSYSVHAQPAKTPMQHTGTPCPCISYHPGSGKHLPAVRKQKFETHTLFPTAHGIWLHSMVSHISLGISGSFPEELNHCLLLWFEHGMILSYPWLPSAPFPSCTQCAQAGLRDYSIDGGIIKANSKLLLQFSCKSCLSLTSHLFFCRCCFSNAQVLFLELFGKLWRTTMGWRNCHQEQQPWARVPCFPYIGRTALIICLWITHKKLAQAFLCWVICTHWDSELLRGETPKLC